MSGAMDGRAHDAGRVYQASGDQHITEHHHHEAVEARYGPDSVRRPAFGRPPVALRDREQLMDRLCGAIDAGTRDQVYVLHGMGGCGKTTVAYALFQHATTGADRVGLWVNASDMATLRGGMLAVAADRGATEGQLQAARSGLRAAADLVWDRLDQSDEPWLLVLDNADDPSILQDGWLRTSPRGTVLVSTRQSAPHWWPYAELHHVGVLPQQAAAQVLCDLAPEAGTSEDAAQIAEKLGRLPLALTLAGGFLSHQVIEPWTMKQYGSRLDGGGQVGLIDRGAVRLPGEDSRQLVSRTWQLSLDALAAQGSPESTALLQLLACYGSDPLPLSLLNGPELAAVLSPARAEAALRGLLDHSLTALVDVGVRCIQTHGVLLASVAAGTPAPQLPALRAAAGKLLNAVVPAVPEPGQNDVRMRLLAPHVLALLRQADDEPTVAEALDVAIRLAISLHRDGDYQAALELASAAGPLAQRTLGGEHRLVLTAEERVARALLRLGRYEESVAVHRRLLAVRERLFGAEDLDTLSSCQALYMPLLQLDQTPEGLALLRRAVAGRKQLLGPGHPLTLRDRSHLLAGLPFAELADEIDRSEVPLPEECATHLGREHAVTLHARLNYGFALFTLGRYEAARDEGRAAAEDYLRCHGPDHSLTLSTQTLYARSLYALGELVPATELMIEVADRRERSLGAEHPHTRSSHEFVEEFRNGRPPTGDDTPGANS
ncbi:tetratricopeptide repeat protein [Streptomyces marispadix]|uniref:Tetratricopeptide repeat protein n=1 Tax=Streptomyces marispadix TaxID=2922868 RepID=A0ABS9SVA6_9ACTN|nr:tetratricopeptide repeat protein [Streptomyces marispadix]MCH6160202.1 tetratricopeptide repeat protein [Streptomyces marispadix]